jgi:ADP-ribose pyrophosphatase YjhB (NUDIX family)
MMMVERETPARSYQHGLLIQRRNIEPKKGHWALSGGYIDNGETWQQAAVREIREELGMETNINNYKLFDVQSGKDNTTLLVFCTYNRIIPEVELEAFIPNEEVSEVGVMWEEGELAFPSHTDCANKFLKSFKE